MGCLHCFPRPLPCVKRRGGYPEVCGNHQHETHGVQDLSRWETFERMFTVPGIETPNETISTDNFTSEATTTCKFVELSKYIKFLQQE